jgi:predicted dehydrogenase
MADGLGKTRVGILGAGYIADFHVRAVNALPDATVVGICDLNLAQAERLAAAYSIDGAYSTLDDLLAHQKLDVVHVLLPPDRHFEAGMRLLEHGVHVLFEKPLCTTADDCRRLLEAAKQRRLQVGTSHNFLFAEPYESLRQVIRDGRLGQLDEVEIVWNKFFPQARFGPFSCWALRAPEHIMLELGPHSIAHLLDLSGNVDDIRVEAGRPIDLPGGGKFFQRWTVVAGSGRTRTELRFSLIEGYTEHHIHVRAKCLPAPAPPPPELGLRSVRSDRVGIGGSGTPGQSNAGPLRAHQSQAFECGGPVSVEYHA